jgi:uncharacterized protein involved in exopolysaccharide biosynthesis
LSISKKRKADDEEGYSSLREETKRLQADLDQYLARLQSDLSSAQTTVHELEKQKELLEEEKHALKSQNLRMEQDALIYHAIKSNVVFYRFLSRFLFVSSF